MIERRFLQSFFWRSAVMTVITKASFRTKERAAPPNFTMAKEQTP